MYFGTKNVLTVDTYKINQFGVWKPLASFLTCPPVLITKRCVTQIIGQNILSGGFNIRIFSFVTIGNPSKRKQSIQLSTVAEQEQSSCLKCTKKLSVFGLAIILTNFNRMFVIPGLPIAPQNLDIFIFGVLSFCSICEFSNRF